MQSATAVHTGFHGKGPAFSHQDNCAAALTVYGNQEIWSGPRTWRGHARDLHVELERLHDREDTVARLELSRRSRARGSSGRGLVWRDVPGAAGRSLLQRARRSTFIVDGKPTYRSVPWDASRNRCDPPRSLPSLPLLRTGVLNVPCFLACTRPSHPVTSPVSLSSTPIMENS